MKRVMIYIVGFIGFLISAFFLYVITQSGFSGSSLIGVLLGLILMFLQFNKYRSLSSTEDQDEDLGDDDDDY